MMYQLFLLAKEVEMRHEQALRQAEQRRLLRQARPCQRKWASRKGCRLLHQFGQLLETLGRRLQQFGEPQTTLLERQFKNSTLAGNSEYELRI